MAKENKIIELTQKQIRVMEETRKTIELGRSFNESLPIEFRELVRKQIKHPVLKLIAQNEPLSNFIMGSVLEMFLPKPKRRKGNESIK